MHRHEGATTSPHQFTGQRQDEGTGLILFPGRAYDPELGRFLQPDPFVQDPSDPQSLNRYSYVRNNPVNLVDPSGYWSFRINIFGFGFEVGSDRVSVSVAGLTAGYDFENQAAFVGIKVGLEVGPVGGSFQASVFYSFSQQQAGVSYGVSAGGASAEARGYYDFRENQFGAGVQLRSPAGNFSANTDGQRTLNGQSLKGAKANLQDFGISEPAAKSFLRTLSTPQAAQIVQGLGWMAVGGALMAGSAGATVATGGLALEVAAPLAIGGAAIAGVGALQVSYAVRAPFDTYPGQTQGKIARELNKAYRALTYGGPAEEIGIGGPNGPGNWQKMKLLQKIGFVVWHGARALRPMAESVLDFYTRQ